MKAIAWTLRILAYIGMGVGVINLGFVVLNESATWRDNGWRIVIIFLAAFGLVYLGSVLNALAERGSKQKQEQEAIND